MDQTFCIKWLEENTDLSTKDIMAAKRYDDDAVMQLMEAHTQLAPTLKALAPLLHKEVFKRFLNACAMKAGSPMRTIKSNGAVLAGGGLNWAYGSYRLELGASKTIKTIKFRSGDAVDVEGQQLNDDFCVVSNWSDWRAALEKKPFPPLKLHLFFESKAQGPYKFGKPWTASSKEYEVLVGQIDEQYSKDKLKLTGLKKDENVTKELKVLSTERKMASMAKARAEATKKLAEKRTKQVINLKAKA